MNKLTPKICARCHGKGTYLYGNTATWHDSWISGQGFTADICDVCWGSGDENFPGPDLRIMARQNG